MLGICTGVFDRGVNDPEELNPCIWFCTGEGDGLLG